MKTWVGPVWRVASRDSGRLERDFKRPKQQLVDENRAIGKRLRKARELVKLSQRKVAAALRENRSWVSKVEQGERRADLAEGVRLMHLYEVDANSILMPELATGAQLAADKLRKRAAGKGGKVIRPQFRGPGAARARGSRARSKQRPAKPKSNQSKPKPKK